MVEQNSEPQKIIGQYIFVPNPCTTQPCLPGMAYAIWADDLLYFVKVNDSFLERTHTWDDFTPAVGELLEATGYVRQEQDIAGQPFFTLEIVAVHRAE